ncbi:recombinase family protein [Sphingomonas baiyangensis]|uniref:Recombinase family protein n=1 Tax=Sphingomonas baiyangensis TaxID=2572576 RepID=A0A4U1L4S7_9SPHN|nr:recombinase family protein [Sphingomonas baiyangensis]TKD51544.1 recombinase family protein [Sphingomonas baiyangensis]
MKPVRCAIYTRKSSDEGLEQAFNSLDAQREACAAYVLSQASEGWAALPDIYDDGGLSGGTLQRPALQRLLARVDAGEVDIIVVYKVDRLTRSLFDFAKLVERLDAASVSFVSVTQSFNTTTSMGRLTLNMLLSFAQFEREVTAERIRDKIAASKAKGMWMGGNPPIGYAPDGRTLKVVEPEAAQVRAVFERYLQLGNVRQVADALARDRITTPQRINGKGKAYGGCAWSRGQIYKLLSNPIYLGLIEHKGARFKGLHPAIIDADLWEQVQARLAQNLQGHRTGGRASSPSLLAGKVVDDDGRPLIAAHATKRVASVGSTAADAAGGGRVRYRYYVTQEAHRGEVPGMRIPARELEALVIARIQEELADPFSLADKAALSVPPHDVLRLHGDKIAPSRQAIAELIEQVKIASSSIDIVCSGGAIAALLGLPAPEAPTRALLHCEARLTRSGRVVRLVNGKGTSALATPDAALVRLVTKAHRWWDELRKGELDTRTLAMREGVQASYLTRVLRLAFLAPDVIEAMLAGRHGAGATVAELTLGSGVDPAWDAQRRALIGAI